MRKRISQIVNLISKWIKYQFELARLKHSRLLHFLRRCFSFLLGTLAIISCLLILLHLIGSIIITDHGWYLAFNQPFNPEFDVTNLVSTQSNMTLLVVSFIALFPAFSDKKFLGRSTLDVVFPFSSRKLIKIISFLLFINMFVNICFDLKGLSAIVILGDFTVSAVLLMILVFGFSSVFLNEKALLSRLQNKCYRDNIAYIKKAHHVNNDKNHEVDLLTSAAFDDIEKGNLEYDQHLDVLIKVSKLTSFNYQKELQTMYLESFYCNDALSQLAVVARFLLSKDHYIEACNLCSIIQSNLRYYEIVPLRNYAFSSLLSYIIRKIEHISNYEILDDYLSRVLFCITMDKWQNYLFSQIDLNNFQNPQKGKVRFSPSPTYFEELYKSLRDNKYITQENRVELYKSIKDLDFGFFEYDEDSPSITKSDFLARIEHKAPTKIPNIYKAVPLSLLYLKIIENYDLEAADHISLTCFSHPLRFYIKLLISLALCEFIFIKRKRYYDLDLNVNPEKAIVILNKIVSGVYLSDAERQSTIIDQYKEINEYFRMPNPNREKELIFGFHPRQIFSKEIIDSYFATLFDKESMEYIGFTEQAGKDFQPNGELMTSILNLELSTGVPRFKL